MVEPATQTVLLRPSMKFTQTIVSTGKKKKVTRVRHVGPCEVQMTATQIKSFKDLLQTAPQQVVSSPAKDVPEVEEIEETPEPDIVLTQAE